jgi:hypothetical protein
MLSFRRNDHGYRFQRSAVSDHRCLDWLGMTGVQLGGACRLTERGVRQGMQLDRVVQQARYDTSSALRAFFDSLGLTADHCFSLTSGSANSA